MSSKSEVAIGFLDEVRYAAASIGFPDDVGTQQHASNCRGSLVSQTLCFPPWGQTATYETALILPAMRGR